MRKACTCIYTCIHVYMCTIGLVKIYMNVKTMEVRVNTGIWLDLTWMCEEQGTTTLVKNMIFSLILMMSGCHPALCKNQSIRHCSHRRLSTRPIVQPASAAISKTLPTCQVYKQAAKCNQKCSTIALKKLHKYLQVPVEGGSCQL